MESERHHKFYSLKYLLPANNKAAVVFLTSGHCSSLLILELDHLYA